MVYNADKIILNATKPNDLKVSSSPALSSRVILAIRVVLTVINYLANQRKTRATCFSQHVQSLSNQSHSLGFCYHGRFKTRSEPSTYRPVSGSHSSAT